MQRRNFLSLPLTAVLSRQVLPAQYVEGKGEVPYVPTPEEVVDAMLKLAGVTRSDIVYDLGCGDGRIVVRAVKNFGAAKGVGIDIDPERIKEANENAQKNGIASKVSFIEKDLYEADIKEATVVTLYLLSSVNLKLRPKLLKDLRPGTRVVSHQFDMGDWKPDKKIEIGYRSIYLWTIPKPA